MAGTIDHLFEAVVLPVATEAARLIRGVLRNRSYRIYLFGSWVTGKARERSDIDIGIEGPSPVGAEEMFQIREACEKLPTLYTLDVVDLKELPDEFRQYAYNHRIELEPE